MWRVSVVICVVVIMLTLLRLAGDVWGIGRQQPQTSPAAADPPVVASPSSSPSAAITLSATSGTLAAGTRVTISGDSALAGATAVTFGGTAAQIVSSTANSVTVVVPSNPNATAVDIIITGGTGGTITLPSAFTYTVSSTPTRVYLLEGEIVRFIGLPVLGGAYVRYVNGAAVTDLTTEYNTSAVVSKVGAAGGGDYLEFGGGLFRIRFIDLSLTIVSFAHGGSTFDRITDWSGTFEFLEFAFAGLGGNPTFPAAPKFVGSCHYAFGETSAFNPDVSTWDVSAISDFSYMFTNTPAFTGVGLSEWDVSLGTNFQSMFGASGLTTPDLTGWDMSSAVKLSGMFTNSASFNGDVSTWDVSSVLGFDMMFTLTPFVGDISAWDVSSGTTFAMMFMDNTAFNRDVSAWDMSSAVNISNMFAGATAFDLGGKVGVWAWWNSVPAIVITNALTGTPVLSRGDISIPWYP